MQRVNEFVFYELAVQIHGLTELGDGIRYSDVWWAWHTSRAALDEIYRQRPLNFTTNVALRLYNAITAVVPKEWDDMIAKLPRKPEDPELIPEEEPAIFPWLVTAIVEAAKEFETVLRTECQVMDSYYVSKKGAYSTADLIEHAHYQIPETTRGKVPEQTKNDFDQAGKCIAFDLPTAAAFHLLRSTEAVIRQYYEVLVPGVKKAPPKARNWGVYIKLLSDHGAEPKVTSLLFHIKDAYRNPVLHPEENYTDEMVQVLFGVCVSAIVMIVDALNKIGKPSDAIAPVFEVVEPPVKAAPALPESSTESTGAGMKIVS
ncbi:MAG: hypothetical protein ABSA80_18985 [Terriglobales bacterium]|jgi:hypothetical protein